MAYLLQSTSIRTVYYALGQDDISLGAFLYGMLRHIPAQIPIFGRHSNLLSSELYTKEGGMIEIAQAFAQDLAEVSSETFIWILDEYDHSDSVDDIQHFVDVLLDFLPSHVKILINSRTLPRLPWTSLMAQGKVLILQDKQVIKQNHATSSSSLTEYHSHIKVCVLGHGDIYVDDRLIETWDGHLPRLLFFFALDRPMLTRSEICETFWSEMNHDQAVNVFHVTKRRLHKALGMDALIHLNGYYTINPNIQVESDLDRFVNALEIARNKDNDPITRLNAWQQTVELYRAPFLQGYTEKWVVNRRKDFQYGYIEALLALADKRMEEQRPEHALIFYQRAITDDYNRQDIHRKIIQLYLHMGRRSEALAHYNTLLEKLPTLEEATQTLLSDLTS
ncbi:MAG: AfsR/SARP family transcriptional regulator [Phototrophicaceae bacterium]